MVMKYLYRIVVLVNFCCVSSTLLPNNEQRLQCDVQTQIESGWVCGRIRSAEEDVQYASFRGVPYAQQPVGPLRFKALQPLDPWSEVLLTTEDGPICPQYDEIYGRMARPAAMSEACIYANVHVPLKDPQLGLGNVTQNDLPILVFIHGGGFQIGSGGSDIHGPEYLVSKGVLVITFNYRLNVFGYLSLNSTKIPGNNGLRDTITLLNWVQRNARAFGGDPDNVTLGGHSCGSVVAHLLSLSDASKGLFKRVFLMSGLATGAFYTTSPSYADTVAQMFLRYVGINSTDADGIHDQLVQIPLEKIMEANRIVQFKTGVISFAPVVEPEHSGVTRILDDDPANLIKQGRGKDLPMLIGSTSIECEYFKDRIIHLDLVERINESPAIALPVNITYSVSSKKALELFQFVSDRYFQGNLTVDKYIRYCTDSFFTYPAIKVAEWRASEGGAPAYRYQFDFDSTFNVVKFALMMDYKGGSAHVEDMTFVFRTNSMMEADERSFPPRTRDDLMKNLMTSFVVNFMRCSHPLCDNQANWPATDAEQLNYQLIKDPVFFNNNMPLTQDQRDMLHFHKKLFQSAGM